MAYERAEILAGAGVLAVAIAFTVYAAQGAGFGGGAESYPLTASFRSAEGIRVGSDVRLAGVKVGTVTGLGLNPTTYFADATISVTKDVALPVDSAILISSEGLLGGNFIELQPGGAVEMLEPGAEIEDTQGAVSLITLLLKFAGGGSDAGSPASDAAGAAAP